MSRSIGSELPSDLLARLSGRDLESVASKVIQIVTLDASGWPHPALLSYFEVIATSATRIRLAAYATSTTSGNLRRAGTLTLVVIDERTAYYVKAHAVEIARTLRSTDWNAAFECRIEQVLADEVNEEYEPGAHLVSGVTYFSPRRTEDLERARLLLAELNALGHEHD